jgi:hypothetical protein
MKNSISFCAILFSMIGFFSSCDEKTDGKLLKAEIETERQVIVNALSANPDSLRITSAKARLTLNKSGEVCVLINYNKNKSSDTVDELIVVQTGLPQKTSLSQDLGIVKLTKVPNAGIFIENESYLYYLGLANEKTTSFLNKINKNVSIGLGFGISFLKGKWNISSKISESNASIFERIHDFRVNGGTTNNTRAEKCDNGGPGSTSCSITENLGPIEQSCSVSCGSGYYSCCKATVLCTCVKDSQATGGSVSPVYVIKINRITGTTIN